MNTIEFALSIGGVVVTLVVILGLARWAGLLDDPEKTSDDAWKDVEDAAERYWNRQELAEKEREKAPKDRLDS